MTKTIKELFKDATQMTYSELEEGVKYWVDSTEVSGIKYNCKMMLIHKEGNNLCVVPITQGDSGLIVDLVEGQSIKGTLDLEEVKDYVDTDKFTLYTLSLIAILKEMYTRIPRDVYEYLLEDVYKPKKFPKIAFDNADKYLKDLKEGESLSCSAVFAESEFCYEVTNLGEQGYKFKLNTLSHPVTHFRKTGILTFDEIKRTLISMNEIDFSTNYFVKFMYYPDSIKMRELITIYAWSNLAKLKALKQKKKSSSFR